MERQKYNQKILEKLSKIIEEHPYLRFGQILVNYNIIELVPDKSHGDVLIALDPFNEESKVTWERMKDTSF